MKNRPIKRRRNLKSKTRKRTNQNQFEYGTLEERRLLIVGFAAVAPEVVPGGDFDGVVSVSGCTGSLLESSSHILTAAHCSTTTRNPTASRDVVRFDLARGSNPVSITIPVSATEQINHPSWDGSTRNGFDISIYELEDGSGNRLIAPFGAQRYSVASNANVSGVYTMVGYGETGTGATGEQGSEVQRIRALSSGSSFTVNFSGNTSASIPFGASNDQVQAALAPIIGNGVRVSDQGLPAGTWDIRFRSDSGIDQPLMTGIQADGTPLSVVTQFDGNLALGGGVKRTGMNTYDANTTSRFTNVPGLLFADFDGPGAGNLFGGTGLGSQETFEARGDSGGPGFQIAADGSLEIVSVVSATTFSSTNITTDINNYQERDNSFGEGRINTNAAFFKSSFIDPIVDATGYHAVLDMGSQVLGRDGLTEDLQFQIQRQGNDLVVTVDNMSAPGVYSGEYFRAPISDLTGFTINGGFDNETFVIQNDLGIDITIDGGSGTDTIVGSSGDDTYNLTGNDTGTFAINGTSTVTTFTSIDTADGGAGMDTFVLTSGHERTNVVGGAGQDIIVGSNDAARWRVDGDSSGRLLERSAAFESIEVLRSGTADDIFFIEAGGENIAIEGNSGNDIIEGSSTSTTYTLTGDGEGEITNRGIDFEEIEGLNGGGGDDIFVVQPGFTGITLDGGGGTNEIQAADVTNTFIVSASRGGFSQAGAYRFANMDRLVGGSLDDDFRIAAGGSNIQFVGNGGTDQVFGFNERTFWNLSSGQSGEIAARGIAFSDVDELVGSADVDRFQVTDGGDIDLAINGQAGFDNLTGYDIANTWNLDGPGQGDLASSNVTFQDLEMLRGGSDVDVFRFNNANAVIANIDGGSGADRLDHSALSQVNLRVEGFGSFGSQDGFDGFGSGFTGRFFNIERAAGSASLTDNLAGPEANSLWVVNDGVSTIRTESGVFTFEEFENLRGGSQDDRFVIEARQDSAMRFIGSDGEDRLRVRLEGITDADWTYFADGVGRFSFESSPSLTYHEIETLENFDIGDSIGTARHRLGTNLRFGSGIDPEDDVFTEFGTGDDNTSVDDEDGVFNPVNLIAHFRAATDVFSTGDGFVDAWVDFNGDGTFSVDEQIADSTPVVAGFNRIEYAVPGDAVEATVASRFRISESGGLAPTGLAESGEVEDHLVQIERVDPGTSELLADPFNAGRTILVMAGTAGNDTIVVNPNNQGELKVVINGRTSGFYNRADVYRIGSFGAEGNDSIIVTSVMTTPSELYGNEGNDDVFGAAASDYLRGGIGNDRVFGGDSTDLLFGDAGSDELYGQRGSDVLSGGSGSDRLFAGEGFDVLFGGSGYDRLHGQGEGDALIGNRSTLDNDENALSQAGNLWNTSASYQNRIDSLQIDLGLILGDSIFDDGVEDQFFGGEARDFFADLGEQDEIFGQEDDELSFS